MMNQAQREAHIRRYTPEQLQQGLASPVPGIDDKRMMFAALTERNQDKAPVEYAGGGIIALKDGGYSSAKWQPYFVANQQRTGYPAQWADAQVWAESGYNPNAVSSAGAVGIAQFMPGTAKDYNLNPMDPVDSLRAQSDYMAKAYSKFGDMDLALASYNMGMGGVQKLIDAHGTRDWSTLAKHAPEETRGYVAKINKRVHGGVSSPGGIGGMAAQQAAPLDFNQPQAMDAGQDMIANQQRQLDAAMSLQAQQEEAQAEEQAAMIAQQAFKENQAMIGAMNVDPRFAGMGVGGTPAQKQSLMGFKQGGIVGYADGDLVDQYGFMGRSLERNKSDYERMLRRQQSQYGMSAGDVGRVESLRAAIDQQEYKESLQLDAQGLTSADRAVMPPAEVGGLPEAGRATRLGEGIGNFLVGTKDVVKEDIVPATLDAARYTADTVIDVGSGLGSVIAQDPDIQAGAAYLQKAAGAGADYFGNTMGKAVEFADVVQQAVPDAVDYVEERFPPATSATGINSNPEGDIGSPGDIPEPKAVEAMDENGSIKETVPEGGETVGASGSKNGGWEIEVTRDEPATDTGSVEIVEEQKIAPPVTSAATGIGSVAPARGGGISYYDNANREFINETKQRMANNTQRNAYELNRLTQGAYRGGMAAGRKGNNWALNSLRGAGAAETARNASYLKMQGLERDFANQQRGAVGTGMGLDVAGINALSSGNRSQSNVLTTLRTRLSNAYNNYIQLKKEFNSHGYSVADLHSAPQKVKQDYKDYIDSLNAYKQAEATYSSEIGKRVNVPQVEKVPYDYEGLGLYGTGTPSHGATGIQVTR